ncbi:hypothetical protein [Actinomadura graeca]|uniref:hypothetical protein n=1 Tax=Actinomadura graeca TaxID=2750812 RepID=UPI003B835481
MGLHHRICHVLGGRLDLPHAETHAVMLPHVAAFTLASAPEACEALRRALTTDSPATALAALADRLGAPRTLGELGVSGADLPGVVDDVLARPCAGPRPVDRESLRALLEDALGGRGG